MRIQNRIFHTMKILTLLIILSCNLLLTHCDDSPRKSGGIKPWVLQTHGKERADLTILSDIRIPDEFDARKQWPNCKSIGHIQAQGECNIGFFFAIAATVDDRVCIESNQTLQWRTSVEDLITCCNQHKLCWEPFEPSTCEGIGDEKQALEFLEQYYAVSGGDVHSHIGCKPTSEELLSGERLGRIPLFCEEYCTNIFYNTTQETNILEVGFGTILPTEDSGMTTVKLWMMEYGPVLAPIVMIDDLREKLADPSFTGIYDYEGTYDVRNEIVEMVRVIGWGDLEVPHWLIASTYNDTRFFKIQRGKNLLNIEEFMYRIYPSFVKREIKKEEKEKSGGVVRAISSCFSVVLFRLFLFCYSW